MKNVFVIITCLLLPLMSLAQKRLAPLEDNKYAIGKRVSSTNTGNFYIAEIKYLTPTNQEYVRKINSTHAIIKALKSRELNTYEVYYSLDYSWKLSSAIRNNSFNKNKAQIFSVRYSENAPPGVLMQNEDCDIIRKIKNSRITIIRAKTGYVTNKLIANPNIEYVDLAERKATEETPIRQYNPELNRINLAKKNYPNLTGENMIISLKENSIDDSDIDLTGKVTIHENSSLEFTQHAKEMGTLIAGYGNTFKTGLGVVPEAKIVCTDFKSLFAEDIDYFNLYNIKIQNHSYGTDIENYYGNESLSYDQLSIDDSSLIHVFSSGNSGDKASKEGNYRGVMGYANLTGSFKQAKNVLVVGMLDSVGNYVNRSSCGPTYDGRLKPELMAYGGEGSSESAALASGCISMLQQHFLGKYSYYPSSALVKSILIAGAEDAFTPGIDYKTGYGSIDINRSLQLLDSGWYITEHLQTGGIFTKQLFIPENTQSIKIVMSWIDPPANPEDAIALINDLDIQLISPSNEKFHPWILDSTPDVTALSSLPFRGEDHLNNVEMISLGNPISGYYTLKVVGNLHVGDSQEFNIAYHIEHKNRFSWTFPTSNDHIEAGTKSILRWDSSFENQDGILSLKYGHENWEEIGIIDLSSQFLRYELKDTSIYAQLKMAISDQEFISDIFPISVIPKITVDNDCDDEFILSWNAVPNSDAYQLYELQSNRLVQIMTPSETKAALDKTKFKGKYYAVEPVLIQNTYGLKSYTINYKNINKGCYLDNFLAFLDVDKFANIQLTVNVPDDIEEISIYKKSKEALALYNRFPPEGKNNFTFQDYDLVPGRYSYFTQLSLKNGKSIYSDTLNLYYTDEKTVIVFPNPVKDDFVRILNDYSGAILYLIDDKGRFIKQYDLVNTLDDLDLSGLRQGVYIFRIFFDGNAVNSGKIIRL